MQPKTIIALDAMGGDHAPLIVLAGAEMASLRHPEVGFLLFGDEARLIPLLADYPRLQKSAIIRHASDVITGDMKPSVALRQGRNSSMRLAIQAVETGEAACVVSAGNTGAFMALAKFVLKTLPGIDRPAISGLIPTTKGEMVLLDIGANVECDAENLVQFSLMGAVFAKTVLGIENPSLALLNIGSEEMKGHDELRAAAALMQERPMPGHYVGFVEANDILTGKADVVVTDGFTGNSVLKAIEGTSKLMGHFLKQTFASSLFAKIGYLFAKGAFARLRHQIDPRKYNGAMLLGLQGVAVKSHGGTDADGFSNAISVAMNLIKYNFNDRIRVELARHYGVSDGQVIDQPAAASAAASGDAA